jgi:hypothetical protein
MCNSALGISRINAIVDRRSARRFRGRRCAQRHQIADTHQNIAIKNPSQRRSPPQLQE